MARGVRISGGLYDFADSGEHASLSSDKVKEIKAAYRRARARERLFGVLMDKPPNTDPPAYVSQNANGHNYYEISYDTILKSVFVIVVTFVVAYWFLHPQMLTNLAPKVVLDGQDNKADNYLAPITMPEPYYDSGVEDIPMPSAQVPIIAETPPDITSLYEGPVETEFKYVLRGLPHTLAITLYSGLDQYLSEQSREYYCDPLCPTEKELELEFIDAPYQKEELDRLIELIQTKDPDIDDQARIAINLIQQIPYDPAGINAPNTLTDRYPYEVLYDNSGVCGEKSRLLAYLLRGLGYGVALFIYDEDAHEAVGIKCPQEYSLNSSGYCFVETSRPAIPTDIYGDYVSVGRLTQNPKIIELNDGASFDSIGEEYHDMLEFYRLTDRGRVFDMDTYNSWISIVSKYGLEIDNSNRLG